MKPIHAAFVFMMFAHWVGWKISLGYGICLTAALLMAKLSQRRPFLNKFVVAILLFSVIFLGVNSIHIFSGENTDLVYSNLHLYLNLFFVVAIVLLSPPWEMLEIHKIARLIFWIAFYSIAIEFIAVNFLNAPKESMLAARHSYSYLDDYMGWHRPFGLTGQTSANGGVLLLSFLLLKELKIADTKAICALLAGVSLTISGQAVLSSILVLGLLQLGMIRDQLLKVLLVSGFLLAVYLVLNLGLFQKLSLDYLVYVLWEKAHIWGNLGLLNGWQLLFGTLGLVKPDKGYGTEVFMVESIRLFGIVFTMAFWVFIWVLVRKARLRFIWLAGCLIASLHYPTVFYIEAQLPLALLYLSTLPRRSSLLPKFNQKIAAATSPPLLADSK